MKFRYLENKYLLKIILIYFNIIPILIKLIKWVLINIYICYQINFNLSMQINKMVKIIKIILNYQLFLYQFLNQFQMILIGKDKEKYQL
jgi:hypothetical protein